MTALARQLQARGHDVVFLYSSGAGGLPFVPGLENDQFNESRGQASKMQGEDALRFGMRLMMAQTEAILKSLPVVVRANGVDALLNRHRSALCGIGCDAVGYAVCTHLKLAAPRLLRLHTPLLVWLASRDDYCSSGQKPRRCGKAC